MNPLSISTGTIFSEEDEQEEVEEEEEFNKGKALGYGLRENFRKSFRLADPEFSFMVDAGSVVQDSQSETEFTRGHFSNLARWRSKRRKSSRSEENNVEPVIILLKPQTPKPKCFQEKASLGSELGSGFIIQDSQSKTESTGGHFRNLARWRSKRRKSGGLGENEPKPVISVSDTTPEEDVSLFLMTEQISKQN